MQASDNNVASAHPSGLLKYVILVVGIILLAANLRAPITGIAPVLEQVIAFFQLTAAQAGLLTTLPLLGFALISPLAPKMAKKLGLETTLFVALILIGAGCLSRLLDAKSILFIGTAIIGVGIAIGNVLLPSLIKRDFPQQVALMTSAYVLSMGIVGGGFSALAIPITNWHQMGWQVTMASLSLLALIAMILWLPQLKYKTKPDSSALQSTNQDKIWQHSLAWQVTFFLGSNSLFTYIIVGWLPSILIEAGYSAEKAGAIHGIFLIATAVPGLVLVPLLAKLKDQRIPAIILAGIAGVCSLGLIYFPQFAFLCTVIMGFSSGACFILGLSFISLRTNHSLQAASLSGMAQCVGYSLAATGPMLAGYFHGLNGSWDGALWICASANFLGAVMGIGCGRNITIPYAQSIKAD
ncbi:MFS transporter [Catenovulum sp. 2E275]|uniref:MFS transporter n=1 Tax=Catenovulum sp. 2E275 TaxID=2980497 RepID=UPI0021D05D29|nr:MFS transporter [Catenovulum sp. 2E275]MCU4677649.1 MFS transporter [Catenovulum sp. 2E275]